MTDRLDETRPIAVRVHARFADFEAQEMLPELVADTQRRACVPAAGARARRGMAFIDALFEGSCTLEGALTIGLGLGFLPGANCRLAVETRWGKSMGSVLLDRGTEVLRGLSHDNVMVTAGRRVAEVDPREPPEVFGLGERPLAVALGVCRALGLQGAGAANPLPSQDAS